MKLDGLLFCIKTLNIAKYLAKLILSIINELKAPILSSELFGYRQLRSVDRRELGAFVI